MRCSFNKHAIVMKMSAGCQLWDCFIEFMSINAKHGRAGCYHVLACTRTKHAASSLRLALPRTKLSYHIHIKSQPFGETGFSFLQTAEEYQVKDQNNSQRSYSSPAFVQVPGTVSLRGTWKKNKMEFTEDELYCDFAVEKHALGRLGLNFVQGSIRIFTAKRFYLLIQLPFSY